MEKSACYGLCQKEIDKDSSRFLFKFVGLLSGGLVCSPGYRIHNMQGDLVLRGKTDTLFCPFDSKHKSVFIKDLNEEVIFQVKFTPSICECDSEVRKKNMRGTEGGKVMAGAWHHAMGRGKMYSFKRSNLMMKTFSRIHLEEFIASFTEEACIELVKYSKELMITDSFSSLSQSVCIYG